MASQPPKALLFALRNSFEHNPAIVYKAVYLGETISVIESAGWEAEVFDIDVDDLSLTGLIQALRSKPKALFLWSEVHHARQARQIALTAKKVSPETKVFVFGRGTAFIPQYFERYPFDAVHTDGDREAAIADYIALLDGKSDTAHGVSLDHDNSSRFVRTTGIRMRPELWPLPSLSKLAVEKYREFTLKTHGEHYTYRLGVTVSKGCALNCAYCGAPKEEGSVDRRRPYRQIFEWAETSGFYRNDAVMHLFAANLFADHQWIANFCDEYSTRGHGFHWRGVTTVTSLTDAAIVRAAGENGCNELAVGIETLSHDANRTAKSTMYELEAAVGNSQDAGIKLKGLVMLGYPGQREEDVKRLEQMAQDWQITLRYTGYTPLHRLSKRTPAELDAMDIEAFDRRTYFDPDESKLSAEFFYDRITTNGGYFVPSKQFSAVRELA